MSRFDTDTMLEKVAAEDEFVSSEDKKRSFYTAGVYDLSRFSPVIDTTSDGEDRYHIDACEKHWLFLSDKNKVPERGVNSYARVEILYGGAGSGKSFTVAQYLVTEEWANTTGARWYIIRKTSNSLKTSSYHLIKFMCDKYNVEFKENKTDKIIWINGNELLFRGLDDPEKIKSTDVNSVWVEEATELNQDDFEQLDLRTRLQVPEGCRRNRLILTFNPISKQNWIYKHFFHPTDAVFDNFAYCKTTYLDNPFLDEDSVNTIIRLKKTNFLKYRIYALAEWGVAGKVAWETAVERNFNIDLAIKQSTYLMEGADWGHEDPNVLLSYAIDVPRRRIYIYREVYVTQTLVEDFAKICADVTGKIYNGYADPARPDNLKMFNLAFSKAGGQGRLKPAKRRKGTKERSYKIDILDFLNTFSIYIHPSCPKTALELPSVAKKLVKGSETEYLDELEDGDDHASDCTIYMGLHLIKRMRGKVHAALLG